MSQPSSKTAAIVKEKTFSSYNAAQGKAYAQIRRDYHPNVYQAVIDQHKASGGHFGTLLDVGCGPGNVTRGLAAYFEHAIGLDPSEGMIEIARSLGGETSKTQPLWFEISTAESLGKDLDPPIEDASVDLVTAGNAAHWFDMQGFWEAAARVLKPGGNVALWTSGDVRVHPSVPNSKAIQAAMKRHDERDLKPYFEPGNLLTRNCYVDLPLPWTLERPVKEFEKAGFFRREFPPDEQFFVGEQEADLNMFEKMMATGSAEVRWRQAHPDDVGTERDALKMLRKEIEGLLHAAGVEQGEERLRGAVHGALLVVKKSQA